MAYLRSNTYRLGSLAIIKCPFKDHGRLFKFVIAKISDIYNNSDINHIALLHLLWGKDFFKDTYTKRFLIVTAKLS